MPIRVTGTLENWEISQRFSLCSAFLPQFRRKPMIPSGIRQNCAPHSRATSGLNLALQQDANKGSAHNHESVVGSGWATAEPMEEVAMTLN